MGDLQNYKENIFESIKNINEYEQEFWHARDLQDVLQYVKWGNFKKVIEKAKEACNNSDINVSDHFAEVGKMIELAKGAKRKIDDIMLSRYACYLIVQNADSKKDVVALGQTYFAIQTRKQELADEETADDFSELSEDRKRLTIRNELKHHNKELVNAANDAGVKTAIEYAIFQNHGYKGLYGGLDAKL